MSDTVLLLGSLRRRSVAAGGQAASDNHSYGEPGETCWPTAPGTPAGKASPPAQLNGTGAGPVESHKEPDRGRRKRVSPHPANTCRLKHRRPGLSGKAGQSLEGVAANASPRQGPADHHLSMDLQAAVRKPSPTGRAAGRPGCQQAAAQRQARA